MVLNFFRRSQNEVKKNQFATLLFEYKEIRHWLDWRGRYMSNKELEKEYGIKRSTFSLISQWESENPLTFEEAKKRFAQELGLSPQEQEEGEVLYKKWKDEWERWADGPEEPDWIVDADQAGWFEEQQYMQYERRMSSPAMDKARAAFVSAVSALKNMKCGS